MRPDRLIVTVDSRLRISLLHLTAKLGGAIRKAFEHSNPKYYKAKAMGFWPGKEPKQIKTWRVADGNLTLPRGGMWKLREILREHDQPYRAVDERIEGTGPRGLPDHDVELWDHQRQVVEAALETECGVIRSPVASGKTTAILALACELGLTTLVIVWSGNLLEQWLDRIEKELHLQRSEIGIIRGKMWRVAPITMAMQQTLNSRGVPDNIRQAFGFVVADEVQRHAAKTFTDTIDIFPARYRIGVSDDERRKDGKQFLIHDLFGRVLHEVSRKKLEAGGLVLPVEVRVVPTEFDSLSYQLQREQHDCVHEFDVETDVCTYCNIAQVDAPSPPASFNDLLDEMVVDRMRNELIVGAAVGEIAAGEQVLIFSHRVQHCLNLRGLLAEAGHTAGLLLGDKDNEFEFNRTKRAMMSGEMRVAVGTIQAVGQAMDIPRLGRGVLATPIPKNRQLMRQVSGRICRRADGKKNARLYIIHDDLIYGTVPVGSLRRQFGTVEVHQGGELVGGDYQTAKDWLKERRRG